MDRSGGCRTQKPSSARSSRRPCRASQNTLRGEVGRVVVLSETSHRALREGAHASAPGFAAHLLAIPKDDAPNAESRRIAVRDIDL